MQKNHKVVLNLLAIKTLRARLSSQAAELATCTTAAQTRCVKQAIADTERQLSSETTWTPENTDGAHGVATAYLHSSGARIAKSGKAWTLTVGAATHILPRKATFGHAESLLAAH